MQHQMQTQIQRPVRISTAYISHGGGPLPLLEMQSRDAGKLPRNHSEMIEALKAFSAELPKPDAIIVVSAHWEASEVRVTAHPQPPIIYDYYGFPEEAYSLNYPAKGEVSLATSLVNGLAEQVIDVRGDTTRGFDHGMFIPLSIMYPDSDIPCIQVSITSDLNAAKHIELGQALRKVAEAGLVTSSENTNTVFRHILVLGSGSSFHNMQGFFDSSTSAVRKATRFNNWLQTTLQSSVYSENDRKSRLIDWLNAPDARYAHPREEHLMPLHVCYGVNNRKVDKAISLTVLTKPASMFFWFY